MFPCPNSMLEVLFPVMARHALSSIKPAIESSQITALLFPPRKTKELSFTSLYFPFCLDNGCKSALFLSSFLSTLFPFR